MPDRVGQELGNYHLIRLLGQGGFADVYLAQHIHLDTQAAIKVLSIRLTNDNMEQFRNEARTIARLVHPHIVRILDFGVKEGTPYLVMDYAPHGTIRKRHPRGVQLSLPTIVNYVKEVASALEYAHERKLVHRDVKPENLLLGEHDEVLLSDFGIAIVTQSSRYQNTQEVVGTAAYMAPEQLQGKPRYASDQYALGIIVYEWLCGNRPFQGTFTELYSQHLFVPPPSLQEKVSSIPPAVEQVVFTALEKDLHKRFATVQAFATALEQSCQESLSRPGATPGEYLPPSHLSLPGEGIASSQPEQSPLPTNTATPAIHLSQPTIAATPLHTPDKSPSSTSEFIPADELQSSHSISRRAVVISLAGLAIAGSVLGWIIHSQRSAQPPVSLATTSTVINDRTVTPKATLSPTPIPIGTTLLTYHGHSSWMTTARWSPNKTQIASGSADKTVQVWDATTAATLYTYRGHSDIVVAAEWSPNGTLVASSGNDRTVQVWDSLTGANVYIYHGHSNIVYDVAWSPNGARIASCSWDGTVQIWDAITGTLYLTYHGHSGFVFSVAWSPDGGYIASGGGDNTARVWDATNGTTLYSYHGHSDYVRRAVWSPNGARIASASHDKTVHIWDATTGNNVVIYHGHLDEVDDIGWSSSRQLIASSGADRTVQIWNPINANTVFTYHGHSAKINALGWSPDGTRIVSGDDLASVQIWQALSS